MGQLIVKQVSYYGDKWVYVSPELQEGVNIIEGENGNGKSTFTSFIYYGLGGYIKAFDKEKGGEPHEQITNDTNNFVELRIIIDDQPYLLRRAIGTNFISVSDASARTEALPLNRQEGEKVFSDWLLDLLGIKALDIYQGTKAFKLNIKDLFRLFYHDQNPDPKKIFKSPDTESFVSDSEYVRKLIFRVLLGKTFEEYYKGVGELKQAEYEKNVAKSLKDEINSLSSNLHKDGVEIINAEHLFEEIIELKDQLGKLESTRESLKGSRPEEGDKAWDDIRKIKESILRQDAEMQTIKDEYSLKVHEVYKFQRYYNNLVREVTQLKKIIHTQDSLEVLNQNSCPFCFGEIERKENKCYCGSTVEEETFKRFFYSTDEYWDILKARKKSAETTDQVIQDTRSDISSLEGKINKKETELDSNKSLLRELLQKIDSVSTDVDTLNEIDDKSLEIKNNIQILEQRLDFEKRLNRLNADYNTKNSKFKGLERSIKILELKATTEMESLVELFNKHYNELMTGTLKKCRSASIDIDTYEPIIDGGYYREASSRVSVRFNYFLTILRLSVLNKEIRHPKFLLIDTPQTAGIDRENMNNLIGQLSAAKDVGFQVILTTGHNLYPDTLKERVLVKLSDDDKLLKLKEDLSS